MKFSAVAAVGVNRCRISLDNPSEFYQCGSGADNFPAGSLVYFFDGMEDVCIANTFKRGCIYPQRYMTNLKIPTLFTAIRRP